MRRSTLNHIILASFACGLAGCSTSPPPPTSGLLDTAVPAIQTSGPQPSETSPSFPGGAQASAEREADVTGSTPERKSWLLPAEQRLFSKDEDNKPWPHKDTFEAREQASRDAAREKKVKDAMRICNC
jgi:hypothetical protein